MNAEIFVPAGEQIRTAGDDASYIVVEGLAYAQIGDRFLGVVTAGDVVGPDSGVGAMREAEIIARTDIRLRHVRQSSCDDEGPDGALR